MGFSGDNRLSSCSYLLLWPARRTRPTEKIATDGVSRSGTPRFRQTPERGVFASIATPVPNHSRFLGINANQIGKDRCKTNTNQLTERKSYVRLHFSRPRTRWD